MSEVPIKRYTFKCCRLVEDHSTYLDRVIAIVALRNLGDLHIPPIRARSLMTGKDVMYNDIRRYLKNNEVGFLSNLANSVGDDFLMHMIYLCREYAMQNCEEAQESKTYVCGI
jgi:hypothetical protein